MFGPTWLAVWVVCCATLITGLPTVSDDTTGFALNWLRSYGYLFTTKANEELSIADVNSAVRCMQAFASLPETGEVDADTLQFMKMPRCGVPDMQPDEDGQLIKHTPTTQTKWTKNALTYKFIGLPTEDLTQSEVESSLAAAFKLWSDICPLTFSLVVTGPIDIAIKFATGFHGDGMLHSFDGKGKVLAHAFYPAINIFNTDGDIHFDDDETFKMHNTWSPGDIDLLAVATHEIGHSIGLTHSDSKSAVMWPHYWTKRDYKLHQEDIDRAQALYGPKSY